MVDMRSKIHSSQTEYLQASSVIVVDIRGFSIGLAVDTVDGIVALTDEHTKPVDESHRRIWSPFVVEIIGRSGSLALLQIPVELMVA